MTSEQRGRPAPQGEHWKRYVADPNTPTGPWEGYLRFERRLMRYACPWGVLLNLPAIPIAAHHGLSVAVAAVIGAVVSVAFLAVALTWRQPWSWPALAVLVVASVWPAALWAPWWFFWALGVLFYALMAVLLWRLRAGAREEIARFGARYADWGNQ